MTAETNKPTILSRKEAAAYLGICLTTLDRLDIPKTRVRHKIIYRRETINKWIDDRAEKSGRGK